MQSDPCQSHRDSHCLPYQALDAQRVCWIQTRSTPVPEVNDPVKSCERDVGHHISFCPTIGVVLEKTVSICRNPIVVPFYWIRRDRAKRHHQARPVVPAPPRRHHNHMSFLIHLRRYRILEVTHQNHTQSRNKGNCHQTFITDRKGSFLSLGHPVVRQGNQEYRSQMKKPGGMPGFFLRRRLKQRVKLFVEIALGARDGDAAGDAALAVLHALHDARRLAAFGTVGRLRRVHCLLAVTCFCNLGHRWGVSPFRIVSAHTRKTLRAASTARSVARLIALPLAEGLPGQKMTPEEMQRRERDSLLSVYMKAVCIVPHAIHRAIA